MVKLITLFLALVLFAAPALFTQDRFHLQKVTDNVYTFIGPDPTNDWLDANATVIIGDNEVFIVDATLTPETGKQIVNFIKETTSLPVKHVFVTHWHYDHSYGISAIKDAYPDIEIISTEKSKELAMDNLREYQDEMIGSFDVYVDSARAELKRGTTSNGTKLTEYELSRRIQAIKDRDFYMPSLVKTVYIPPTVTFNSEMTVSLGGSELRLLHWGDGHSPGDGFAYLPDKKILFAGDLIISPIPYAFNCYPSKWIGTLKKISSLDINIIIPGHGDVLYGKDYLYTVISALEEIYSQVKKLAAEGESLKEIKKEADFSLLKTKLAGDSDSKKWAFDNYFLGPLLPRIYSEVKGELE